MKLKSLFLTSMVALALGACSNATEEATTNEASAKGVFTFSVSMPASSSSRADNTVSNGGAEAGTKEENHLTNVAIRLVYTGSTTHVDKVFQRSEFNATPTSEAPASQDGTTVVTYSLATPWEIPAGTFKAYAVVNGDMVDPTASTPVTVSGSYGTNLAGLTIEGGIAANDHFVMSGASLTNTSVEAGQTASASIPVNRLAAKIQETSAKSSFTTPTTITVDGNTSVSATIALTGCTLMNLNTVSNVFSNDNFANGAVAYTDENASTLFAQYYHATQNDTYKYSTYANKAINATTVYCMENYNPQLPTKVAYAATITLPGVDAGTTLYVKDNVVYTFSQLQTKMGATVIAAWGLTENNEMTDYLNWLNAGVRKYAHGVCYYIQDIKTAGNPATAKIARNNWYKLTVNSISGIGEPALDPKDPTHSTYLNLTVEVQPWTVNTNTFDL